MTNGTFTLGAAMARCPRPAGRRRRPLSVALLGALLVLPATRCDEQPPPATAPVTTPEMVLVDAGSYEMGDYLPPYILPPQYHNVKDLDSAHGQDLTFDERDLHQVTIDALYVGAYEVTFDEFDRFCEATGRAKPADEGWGRGQRPVIHVTWIDAMAYCNWLSEQEGLTKCYTIAGSSATCDFSANGYRLPTEAEWEYAAKGGHRMVKTMPRGNGGVFAGTSDTTQLPNYAWYNANSGWTVENEALGKTSPVGQKLGNELGIHDMSGNVWEWCDDWYSPTYYKYCLDNPSECDNPHGPAAPGDLDAVNCRVLRGGSWGNYENLLRTFFRFFSTNQVFNSKADPNYLYENWRIGFRLCRRAG